MEKTRVSLYYVVAYLTVGGLGLLLAPGVALKLLLSTGDYGVILPRLAGVLLLGVATLVLQIVRLRLSQLYVTTLLIRGFFCVSFVWLYFLSHDRLFLVLTGIVSLGMVMTGLSYVGTRRVGSVG